MKNTIFEMIRAGKTAAEVLSSFSTESQLGKKAFAKKVIDAELTELGRWIADRICAGQSTAKVMVGGLLYLFLVASQEDQEDKRFVDFCDELGISKTQAYRSIHVWKVFGLLFQQEPKLAICFCSESLKILAAEHVPQRARDRAIEMARVGRRITIKCAAQLVEANTLDAKGTSPCVQENTASTQRPATKAPPEGPPTQSPPQNPSLQPSSPQQRAAKQRTTEGKSPAQASGGSPPFEAIEFEGTSGRLRFFPNARRGLSLKELIADLLSFVDQLQHDLELDGPADDRPTLEPTN